MARKKIGRPTVVTPEVISKLNEAFAFGASDEEACFYADIAMPTLYKHQERDPSFRDRKHLLKQRPILMARQSVVDKLRDDPNLALKYLERKRNKEFSTRVAQDQGGGENPVRILLEAYGIKKGEGMSDGQVDATVQSPPASEAQD